VCVVIAEISGLSAHTGSEEGGLSLDISGQYFDQTDAPVRVKVGGLNCMVQDVTSTKITCLTPAKPATTASYYLGK
jgi:hypothetical protein